LQRTDRVLKRAEDFGVLFCFLALLLVETGYVAWLERLPAFPVPEQPSAFLQLPPWYGRPRLEVTLLLTVLGGMIAWSALSLVAFFSKQAPHDRNRRSSPNSSHRPPEGGGFLGGVGRRGSACNSTGG